MGFYTWHQINSVDVLRFDGLDITLVASPTWRVALRPMAAELLVMLMCIFAVGLAEALRLGMLWMPVFALSLMTWTVANFTDPGILPPPIEPQTAKGVQKHNPILGDQDYLNDWTSPYCKTCLQIRPRHGTHCRLCTVCVMHHDHHCFVLGTCITLHNMRWFIAYLLSVVSLHVIAIGILVSREEKTPLAMGTLGIVIVVGICMALFTGYFLYVVLTGGSARRGAGLGPSSESPWPILARILCPNVKSLLPLYFAALEAKRRRDDAAAAAAVTTAVTVPSESAAVETVPLCLTQDDEV